jgi:hypothetical protein
LQLVAPAFHLALLNSCRTQAPQLNSLNKATASRGNDLQLAGSNSWLQTTACSNHQLLVVTCDTPQLGQLPVTHHSLASYL